ncbi:MAG: glutaminyl-peptide cyclotransferase, partial [Bacteroidia bacterium]
MNLKMKYLTILGSIIICASLVAMSGCKPDPSGKGGGKKDVPKVDPKNTVQVEFNADSAYRYVAEQVAFGPRVPGTAAHGRTLFYLLKQLQRFTDTAFIQAGDLKISTGAILPVSNVFGRINPENPNRFVLAAHWDTRPQSDEDPFINDKPADGANDGASGVGVLIEIARQLQKLNPTLGIDILFFDQEDGGLRRGAPDTWCVGSQFWGDWAIKNRYTSMGGILLDMVGAKGATFGHEAHSIQFNQSLMLETWRIGQQLG